MKKFLLFNFCCYLSLFIHLHGLEDNADLNNQLKQCFMDDWGVDPHTIAYLMKKFQSLNSTHQESIFTDFISKSKELKTDFIITREPIPFHSQDAVLCAPNHHFIIFENLHVRILWGSTLPGDQEPFHTHQWKSLLVVLQPTLYEMQYLNGAIEKWNGEMGVYELPANEHYACTNIGNVPDEIIRFEVKN